MSYAEYGRGAVRPVAKTHADVAWEGVRGTIASAVLGWGGLWAATHFTSKPSDVAVLSFCAKVFIVGSVLGPFGIIWHVIKARSGAIYHGPASPPKPTWAQRAAAAWPYFLWMLGLFALATAAMGVTAVFQLNGTPSIALGIVCGISFCGGALAGLAAFLTFGSDELPVDAATARAESVGEVRSYFIGTLVSLLVVAAGAVCHVLQPQLFKSKTAAQIIDVGTGCALLVCGGCFLTMVFASLVWTWHALLRLSGPAFRRLWHGKFHYDPDSGQWNRQRGRDRHGPLVDAKGHTELRSIALHEKRIRRRQLIAMVVLIATGLYGSQLLNAHPQYAYDTVFGWGGRLLVLVSALLGLPLVFKEIGYLTTFQRMRAAQPIMPPPAPPRGPEALADAQPFGPAAPATIDEVLTTQDGNSQEVDWSE